jgi:UDP-N-acetylmuramate--alanine ligase
VVEACEYDLSFLNLDYEVAVITGVAPDHLDCFGDERGVREAFTRFAARVPAGGALVLGAGVPGSLPLQLTAGVRCWSVQDHLHVDAVSEDARGFSGWVEGGAWGRGEFRLPLLGRHNLENLRVALLSVLACGVPLWYALPHVASFCGVARRLQDLGEAARGPGGAPSGLPPGVRVIDDFAHHPDALVAAAAAVRARFPRRRVVGIFQPHQVSRTEDFLPGFADALRRFDAAGLCDIFVSRDRHPERADALAAALAEKARVPRLGPARQARAAVAKLLQPGDVCVVMGAGDIDGLASELAGATARPSVG